MHAPAALHGTSFNPTDTNLARSNKTKEWFTVFVSFATFAKLLRHSERNQISTAPLLGAHNQPTTSWRLSTPPLFRAWQPVPSSRLYTTCSLSICILARSLGFRLFPFFFLPITGVTNRISSHGPQRSTRIGLHFFIPSLFCETSICVTIIHDRAPKSYNL